MIAYRCPRCGTVVRVATTTPPTCSYGLTEDGKSRKPPVPMLPVEATNARP